MDSRNEIILAQEIEKVSKQQKNDFIYQEEQRCCFGRIELKDRFRKTKNRISWEKNRSNREKAEWRKSKTAQKRIEAD